VACVKEQGVMEKLLKRACEIEDKTFTKQVVSLLVNYITANPANQVEVLKLVKGNGKIIALALDEMECTFYLEVFLYNCLCN
jgi:hypothetical protein